MSPVDLDYRLRFAVDAAHRAGDLALEHARNPDGLGIQIKGVQDVVTLADKAAEQALRAEVAAVFPHDAMLGEEDGHDAGLGRRRAAVDRRPDRRHGELRAPACRCGASRSACTSTASRCSASSTTR